MENEIKCPKCGSTQLSANKKGFGVGKAAAGAILTGPVGLLAGGIGSNKILVTCMGCSFQFKPEERQKLQNQTNAVNYNAQKKKDIATKRRDGIELTPNDISWEKTQKQGQIFSAVVVGIIVLFFIWLFKGCM